jgi:hypothetical protein
MHHELITVLASTIPSEGKGVTRSQVCELQTKLLLETGDCMGGLVRAKTSILFQNLQVVEGMFSLKNGR